MEEEKQEVVVEDTANGEEEVHEEATKEVPSL